MKEVKHKRGRPIGADKAESLKAEEAMRDRPKSRTVSTPDGQKKMSDWIKNLDETEKQVLAQYKYSQTTSKLHAYTMASLDDEIYEKARTTILEIDAKKRIASQADKQAGGDAVRDEARRRAEGICNKNRVLLERAKPFGPLSLSGAASKIRDEWSKIPPAARLPGEPAQLSSRGVDGPPPSVKTICNYIKLASPFEQQRVGKTSIRKK